jgi:hypothetical protein
MQGEATMQSFIWKALIGVAFTGGLVALGAGAAYADNTTSGDDGTGSGSQAIIGLNSPVSIGGNSVSVLGASSSSGSSAVPPASGSGSGGSTAGNSSLLGGTQGAADANAPVTVAGNSISLIGDSGSASSTVGSPAGGGGAASSDGSSGTTSGDSSTLGGTQVAGDSSAPVTVGGNAISVVGDSSSGGSFAGQSATGSGSTGGAPATTSGDSSTLGGTQVIPDAAVPVTASDDAISVIGDSSAGGTSTGAGFGATGGAGTGIPAVTTSGDAGILGGSQLAPSVRAPIAVGSNAVSVIGSSSTTSGGGTGGSVGGVETFPPATGTSVADLSVDALAVTGVPVMATLLLGILLLVGGAGVMLRKLALRD